MREKFKQYVNEVKLFLLGDQLVPVWVLPLLLFTGFVIGAVLF